jgi:hypothetical protein
MEYAKDILINLKKGQVEKKRRNVKKVKSGLGNRIHNYRFIVSIVLSTLSFIVLDLILISNFINVLISL